MSRVIPGESQASPRPTSPTRDAEQNSAVSRAAQAIREMVAAGELAPGQRLIEPELAAIVGVSRASIREAFRALEAEGLLKIERYKGTSVRRLDRRQILESFEIRELLEGLAARRAAAHFGVAGPLRDALQALRDDLEQAAQRHAMLEYAALNRRLHQCILDAAQSEQLASLTPHLNPPGLLRLVHQRLLRVEAIDRSMVEHHRVISALLAGQADQAEQAMRAHLRSSMQQFEHLPLRD